MSDEYRRALLEAEVTLLAQKASSLGQPLPVLPDLSTQSDEWLLALRSDLRDLLRTLGQGR